MDPVIKGVRSYTMHKIDPEKQLRILRRRKKILPKLRQNIDSVNRVSDETEKVLLFKSLKQLDQRIEIAQEMDQADKPRKVDEGVIAMDDFIKCIEKNGKLQPIVAPFIPNKLANVLRFTGYLAQSIVVDPGDWPESEPELLLGEIRASVDELIRKVKPLHRTISTICEKSQVFYATDRLLTVDFDYGKISESEQILHYGEMEVSIPRDLGRGGSLEEPQLGDFQADLRPYVRICGEKRFLGEKEDFFRELNVYINEKAGRPDVLIYIHGFKACLKKNIRRLAKLKKDLDFEGAVILYSWSSAGELSAYYTDESAVCATISLLHEFIWNIQHKLQITSPRHTCPSRIHLMAHSMGNRALIGALRKLQSHVDRPLIGRIDLPNISEVVFVAADMTVTNFIDLVKGFPSDSQDVITPTLTVYCSRADLALELSHLFHSKIRGQKDSERLGSGRFPELNLPSVDVVDVTRVGISTSTLQHSYHCEVQVVLDDLKVIFQRGQRPLDWPQMRQLRNTA